MVSGGDFHCKLLIDVVSILACLLGTVGKEEDKQLLSVVRATLNCYLWTCTKAVPKIQVKVSWAHTKTMTRENEWMSSNSL